MDESVYLNHVARKVIESSVMDFPEETKEEARTRARKLCTPTGLIKLMVNLLTLRALHGMRLAVLNINFIISLSNY